MRERLYALAKTYSSSERGGVCACDGFFVVYERWNGILLCLVKVNLVSPSSRIVNRIDVPRRPLYAAP